MYHVFGVINTAFIFISLYGVYSQLQTVERRKSSAASSGHATELLSLNQFCMSFLAYLSFFVYGYSISPFNHYIVWPRLIAAMLVAMILWEIWCDRRTRLSLGILWCAIVCLVVSMLGLFFGETYQDEGRWIATTMILIISALLAQGYAHQIKLIVTSGKTGAVDIRMSQFILMMDVSTIAFACSMGLANSWPLMVLAVASGITKLLIMYLFRWVKYSPLARARRISAGLQ
ncbi:hypothetical protein [Planctobacterium marinum]|uniref:Uncharacterized protein n=1 Tax=Planctobacterium marinum TaxID=1631968 RepID=A0AA48HME8_9ALTE|nr:hypothetical protein MACH26_06780 [Planctobacterium marinum]